MKMTPEQIKNAIMSIVIGACVAFMTTLFQELASFIKLHGPDLMSGGVSAYYYIAKSPKV